MAIVGVHEEWLSIKFSRLVRQDIEPAEPIVTLDLVTNIKNYLDEMFSEQDIIIDVIQK